MDKQKEIEKLLKKRKTFVIQYLLITPEQLNLIRIF